MAANEQDKLKQERRGAVRDKLATLVQTRTEALALFSDLISRRPFAVDPEVRNALQEFCEALIDYTASAHFQLYRFLETNIERREPVLKVADEVYPHIVRTTDAILEFNDKYEKAPLEDCVDCLPEDLSRLGEALADRIQLEDRMIGVLSGARH
ncbi:MAG: sigma D regulator [Gammaproteobacteria bacterium]|jgi:regulator of sigma D|nr:sigma D regulator [Gammaproteobacteria bacterium]MCW9057250.1 sigma D regulator [Gammaproteobacteria bacterium]